MKFKQLVVTLISLSIGLAIGGHLSGTEVAETFGHIFFMVFGGGWIWFISNKG